MKKYVISAIILGISCLCAVPVQADAKAKLSETKVYLAIGQKKQLKVTKTKKKVTWSSSDKKIVKVTKKGKIQGIKKGKATITAKIKGQKMKCKVKVKDAVIPIKEVRKIENAGFVMIGYFADKITCKSSNPEIATVLLTKGGPAEEGPGNEAELVVYGHKTGTITITIRNDCNKKKMQFKVKVKRTEAVTGYEKLAAYIIDNGKIDEDANKYIVKADETAGTTTKIVYDFWEKHLEFSYVEDGQKAKVEWLILGADEPEDQYVVMDITKQGEKEGQYVTTKTRISDYTGKDLVFEEAWYGTPAAEELQQIANEATKNAFGQIEAILKETVNTTIKEVF